MTNQQQEMKMTTPSRTRTSLRADLMNTLREAASERMVGETLLIDRAVENLLADMNPVALPDRTSTD